MSKTITIDGKVIPFEDGQTIMDAAMAAGVYIPHLCHQPEFTPHGSCKLCTVKVNGRNCSACTYPAMDGQEVLNETQELIDDRKRITQMLFVEGNHLCPGCEKTGNCQLQAVAYHLNMLDNHFPAFYPEREVDASHPEVMIDHNRCIFLHAVHSRQPRKRRQGRVCDQWARHPQAFDRKCRKRLVERYRHGSDGSRGAHLSDRRNFD